MKLYPSSLYLGLNLLWAQRVLDKLVQVVPSIKFPRISDIKFPREYLIKVSSILIRGSWQGIWKLSENCQEIELAKMLEKLTWHDFEYYRGTIIIHVKERWRKRMGAGWHVGACFVGKLCVKKLWIHWLRAVGVDQFVSTITNTCIYMQP